MLHLLSILMCHAQNNESILRGKVVDNANNPIPYSNIYIEKLSLGGMCDINGDFVIEKITPGKHEVVVSSVGYASKKKLVVFKEGETAMLTFVLEQQIGKLEEIVVSGKSKVTTVKERPFTVNSINVQSLKKLNLDVNQILNTSTGVRIRESGGLGSDFNFSLNGFSGNQVKFFIDGIPMDNFGSSLTLNNIPSNQISRIEVYKGVVPIQLGADALGGAVNVITNNTAKSFMDVSYSIGSFNTHRASLLGKYFNEKTGFILNANGFFNYSDNNYKMELELPEEGTGIIDGTITEVERFNDAYQSQTLQFEGGFANKSYADRILLGVTGSSNRKEIQHGFNQTQPFGEAYKTDKVLITSFKYQKDNLFTENLSSNIFATYSINKRLTNDTSSKIYDWFGNYTMNNTPTEGEYGRDKTRFTFTDKSVNTGASFVYDFNEKHSVSVSNIFSRLSRTGEDPYDLDGVVPFSNPNYLTKNIAAMAYDLSLINNRWKTTLFGKYFLSKAEAYDEEWSEEDASNYLVKITSDYSFSGYGIATTYFINKDVQVKASYENTYRLPNGQEMFGDGIFQLPNPELKPEKSNNFNIGILAKKSFDAHNVQAEFGYLYRETENLIRSTILWLNYTQSVNLFKAKTDSFEGAIKYNYDNKIFFEVNGTYQNIVNTNQHNSVGAENPLYLDRLPNIPYLFGNASITYRQNDFIAKNNHLSLNFSTHFIEEFYLNWPSQGNREDKFVIPQQVSHNLSLSYAMQSGKYNISLGVTNLMDRVLYDNFNLQKPGRAFSLKLNYFIQ